MNSRSIAMQNSAPIDFPVHDLIRDRWSPRAFADKPVAPEILRSLFEAARWAPSSYNEQPWAYIVATKGEPDDFAKVLSVLVEFNQSWAKNAYVLGLAMCELKFAKNGTPNRNAQYDTGAATALLAVEATARGLAVHQMAGFDAAKARKAFEIPEGWDPLAAMAIGYPGDPASLPASLQERERAERKRKPLSEFVMRAQWGQPAPFVAK
jgi:nitroreductase